MAKIILYHGSPNKIVSPAFGLGNDKHDYGKGFYLTENMELAREWAVCRPDERNGWLHKYALNTEGLDVFDFGKANVLSWLAELMKHRDASDSKRYRILARKFIDRYGIDSSGFDVIKGWRADASYFFIAKEFVRDNVDIDILKKLLYLGGLDTQYCIKSEKAYSQLKDITVADMPVDYAEVNGRYNQRDIEVRINMRNLINSDENKVEKVFSTLFEE